MNYGYNKAEANKSKRDINTLPARTRIFKHHFGIGKLHPSCHVTCEVCLDAGIGHILPTPTPSTRSARLGQAGIGHLLQKGTGQLYMTHFYLDRLAFFLALGLPLAFNFFLGLAADVATDVSADVATDVS